MKETDVHGNYYNKFESTNPIERKLMNGFFNTAASLISSAGLSSDTAVLEAGCAEGQFASFLRSILPDNPIDAFDIGEECINKARMSYSDRNINFSVGDMYNYDSTGKNFGLITLSETLEHLEDPVKALNHMKTLSSGYIFVSVPNEPIWRIMNMARFKYLNRLGNTPGHIQHFNMRSMKRLIAEQTGLKIVRTAKTLPWIMLLLHV